MKKNKFSVMHKIVALVLLGITVPPIAELFILGAVSYSVRMWSAMNIWIAIPISIVALILGNAWGRLGGLILLACSLIQLGFSTRIFTIILMAIISVAGLISLFSRK